MFYNTSHQLISKVPLKINEKHCIFCNGYGALPINKYNNETIFKPKKCYECNGKGKLLK